jgi:magnesium transporter
MTRRATNPRNANGPRRSTKRGLAPGSVVHIGGRKTPEAGIALIEYGPDELQETVFRSVERSRTHQARLPVRWLNVHGLHDTAVLTEIGQRFHLHPLVMEDIANTEQRPKVEDYGNQLFIVARILTLSEDGETLSSEQCSLVLGENFLLSFQERPSGSFEPVRERLRKGHVALRTGGVDLLGYSLIDSLVDNYFGVVERIDERLDMLEEAVFERPASAQVAALHHARRDTLALRRALWPLREVISSLQRGDHPLIKPETRVYLRDVQDHLTFLLESVDAMRETLSGLLDVYLSAMSQRVNQEVRLLAVITTLFMPAALIAGVFGMNFKSMPWLDSPQGFFLALALMAGVAVVLGALFWRRHWLD